MSEHLRGHPIYRDGDQYRYCDDGSLTVGSDRPCGACQLPRTTEGHDPCIGTLPGVMNACCGHGTEAEAYIQYEDGSEVRGAEAVDRMEPR